MQTATMQRTGSTARCLRARLQQCVFTRPIVHTQAPFRPSVANRSVPDKQQASPAPAPTALLPADAVYSAIANVGAKKAQTPALKTFVMGIVAGVYIGFGGLLAFSVLGNMPGTGGRVPAAGPGGGHWFRAFPPGTVGPMWERGPAWERNQAFWTAQISGSTAFMVFSKTLGAGQNPSACLQVWWLQTLALPSSSRQPSSLLACPSSPSWERCVVACMQGPGSEYRCVCVPVSLPWGPDADVSQYPRPRHTLQTACDACPHAPTPCRSSTPATRQRCQSQYMRARRTLAACSRTGSSPMRATWWAAWRSHTWCTPRACSARRQCCRTSQWQRQPCRWSRWALAAPMPLPRCPRI